ncbi:hypothetical protein Rhopal_004320-T1 [Rhodotorula paludigena]|uniref:Uncharacterized protein n=1 Tax=Rhodotorula paludigena TaxID=86838 RepID=A0AAV5GP30_9BASI|nr:hypothetical protein Rhopal_004320-T1 [Rhodotorula paludigena]
MNRPLRRTGICDSARGLPSDDAGLRFPLSCSLAFAQHENYTNDNMGLLSKIADKVTGHDDDDKKRPHGTTYGANDSPYPGANAYGGPNAGFSSPPNGYNSPPTQHDFAHGGSGGAGRMSGHTGAGPGGMLSGIVQPSGGGHHHQHHHEQHGQHAPGGHAQEYYDGGGSGMADLRGGPAGGGGGGFVGGAPGQGGRMERARY